MNIVQALAHSSPKSSKWGRKRSSHHQGFIVLAHSRKSRAHTQAVGPGADQNDDAAAHDFQQKLQLRGLEGVMPFGGRR